MYHRFCPRSRPPLWSLLGFCYPHSFVVVKLLICPSYSRTNETIFGKKSSFLASSSSSSRGERTCDEIFVYVSESVYKCIKMSQILSRFFLLFLHKRSRHIFRREFSSGYTALLFD
jgi:hypothetical protein